MATEQVLEREQTMDKETIQHFMLGFTDNIRIMARMPDNSLSEFTGVTYGFVNDGEGVVILELPEDSE